MVGKQNRPLITTIYGVYTVQPSVIICDRYATCTTEEVLSLAPRLYLHLLLILRPIRKINILRSIRKVTHTHTHRFRALS